MTDANMDVVEFPATILDSDNQPLATGQARLYTKKCFGTFWPQVESDAPKLPKSATMLQAKDGSRYELKNFQTCPHHPPEVVNHCEFDYRLV
jgi:hypothetical protein